MHRTLLSASRLVSLAKGIEETFPGFWYSINQDEQVVRFSIGPTTACQEVRDRQFAVTPVGDSGLIIERDITEVGDRTLAALITRVLDWQDTHMTGEYPDVRQTDVPRLHTELEWQQFATIYQHFLDAIPGLADERIKLEQVHIGLCALSADCSLRGTYLTTEDPFDISYDLPDDGLDKAMREAFKEILLVKETGEFVE